MQKISEQLIEIWKEILGVDVIEMTDNFFELGGNSLNILELHEALNKLYPDKVKVVDIFSCPTIETLSSLIGERIGEDTVQKVKDIEF